MSFIYEFLSRYLLVILKPSMVHEFMTEHIWICDIKKYILETKSRATRASEATIQHCDNSIWHNIQCRCSCSRYNSIKMSHYNISRDSWHFTWQLFQWHQKFTIVDKHMKMMALNLSVFINNRKWWSYVERSWDNFWCVVPHKVAHA